MKKDILGYSFVITPLSDDDGGGFMISFPDFSDCISDGKTMDEAVENGKDALDATIKTLKEFGFPIPMPGCSVFSGKFVQRIPKSLHQRLAIRAKSEGVSLNTLVVSLLAEGIGRKENHPRHKQAA